MKPTLTIQWENATHRYQLVFAFGELRLIKTPKPQPARNLLKHAGTWAGSGDELKELLEIVRGKNVHR